MLNLSSEIGYLIKKAVGIVVCLGLFMAVSCNSPELGPKTNAQVAMSPPVQVNNTREVDVSSDLPAKKLVELYEDRDCKAFVDAFPSTFEEFDQLYGFDDEKGARSLYSRFPEHFAYFFDCPDVPDTEKIDKVIKIGIEGKWNDAVPTGVFEESAFDLFINNPSYVRETLNELPEEKAASFWYFLFDRPHPGDPENQKKVDSLMNELGRNTKQSKLLSEQYEKLQADWKDH